MASSSASAVLNRAPDSSVFDMIGRTPLVRLHQFEREEGPLAGISSGAAVAAMLDVAKPIDRGVIVTVFPDGAEKYLNETFWAINE